MGRLRRGVDDHRRSHACHEIQHALPVADVELVVPVRRQLTLQTLLVPASVSLRTEEHGALVVVHAVHVEAVAREIAADLAPD